VKLFGSRASGAACRGRPPSIASGARFDELVTSVYSHGNEAGIEIAYCSPELCRHLYGFLEECPKQNELKTAIDVEITNDGGVSVFTENF